ncbi:MAG: hypothetical protein R3D85_14455 [Paracoccaceae bacterium]
MTRASASFRPLATGLLAASLAAFLAAPLALGLAAAPAAADTVLTTSNGIISSALCVGTSCAAPETFSSDTLRLKNTVLRLHFDDTSTNGSPANDWRLVANDISGSASYFALVDATTNRQVVRVNANARANALYINEFGNMGFGTSLPSRTLHAITDDTPGLRLEQSAVVYPAQIWELAGNEFEFHIRNQTTLHNPLVIAKAAVQSTLHLGATGVGLWTNAPEAALHLLRDDGSAQFLIEDEIATPAPRTMLALRNNGRPEITLANTDTGGEWSFGAGTNFILKQGAVGSTSSAKTKLFEVDDSGNATFAGTVTSGGSVCDEGCDAVFAPGYDLPSIADHLAQTLARRHLPAVGPTAESGPYDLTRMTGGMLNELEKAHLYIGQLDARNRALEAELAALRHRLDALETD